MCPCNSVLVAISYNIKDKFNSLWERHPIRADSVLMSRKHWYSDKSWWLFLVTSVHQHNVY